VAPEAVGYAGEVREALRRAGIRVELDDRDATLASRVRDAGQRHVPYLVIAGAREAADGTVSVRRRDGVPVAPLSVEGFVDLVAGVASRREPGLGAVDAGT
jgi:threonyl-tRNA synthetase